MTTERLKAVVTTLRQGGMSSEKILEELSGFLKISQETIGALSKAGMSSSEILEEVINTSDFSARVEPTKVKSSRKDIESVKQYLRKNIGIPTNIRGYQYIATAICIYKDGMPMTKELYPMVAKEHGTTSSRVERAIRHAIELLYDRNYDFTLIMGNSICTCKGKPTNSEFITTIVEILDGN